MTQQVVTELVIDSDTSGADRFSQSMDRAGSAAKDGSASVHGMSLAIGGVSVATIAALAGMRAFVDYVGNQTQSLVDMADRAKLAGISVREFQETLFAARSSGISEKDFVSGLDKIGADLTAASRGVTEFGKLFEANGLSIKNANGELKTTKQGVADLAGLVQNASPQIQQAIARIAGVSASWVPFLKQGVEGIEEQKRAAAGLGVIIDDDMINKAKEFNSQWKVAVAAWDLQFKASLAGILPLLIQLANIATTVLNAAGQVGNFFSRTLTPQDQWSSGDLEKQLTGLQQYRDKLAEATSETSDFQKSQWRGRIGVIGLSDSDTLETIDAAVAKVKEYLKQKQEATKVRITAPAGGTVLPATGADGNDALDTEIQRLEKHVAMTKADTEAVGQSEAARAGLRAEASLYAAAERAGFTDLEQFADKFMKIREQVESTTAALAAAKANSDAKFSFDTVGLSDTEKQIAALNRQLHGDDWKQYADDALSNQIRLTAGIKDVRDASLDFAKSFVSGLMQGKSGMEALTAAAGQLATKMADKALTDLFSGNFLQAGVEAVVAIGAQLFSNSGKADEELQKAKDAWAGMADQVTAFNQAAAGFNMGPLTNELESLHSTLADLQKAAFEAKDTAGAYALYETFNAGVRRVVAEFVAGDQALSPLAQSLKDVTDEATGLKETLAGFGINDFAATIDAALTARLASITAAYKATTESGLNSDINTANGVGYLNDVATALQKFNDLSAEGVVDPNLLNNWLDVSVQKIVDDAGLVGDQFSQFTSLFPEFSGVVTESATALAAASDKFAALNKTINDYLDSLKIGDNSVLSPQDQLGAAQSQFNSQLALAQAGNEDALGSITQYASTLLDQAKGFYASSAGYGDVYSQVTAALKGLTGGSGMALGGVVPGYANGGMVGNGTFGVDSVVARYAGGGSIGLAGGEYVMPAAQTQMHLPMLDAMRSGSAANDNGRYFASLGQQLVQAMAGVSMGEITAMREESAALRAEIRSLKAAVVANKPAPLRPADRARAS